MDWAKPTARRDEDHFSLRFGASYFKHVTVYCFLWNKLCIHALNSLVVPLGCVDKAGITLGVRPANEKRHYIVTTSLIGWEHTQTDPYKGGPLVYGFYNAVSIIR